MIVKSALNNLEIEYSTVELGEVEISGTLSKKTQNQLKIALSKSGIEIMDKQKAVLIKKIKHIVIEMVHYADELPKKNFSDYLSKKLKMDYTIMCHIFSQSKGITIEHFLMIHKIEKAKELLVYDDLSIKAIASKLHFTGSRQLSNQFKKLTGLTPTFFMSIKAFRKKGLEGLEGLEGL